jgi:O-methyltransferase/methyltransferase family protein
VAELSPPQEMIRRFMEIVPARAILVAAKLGIADHINAEGASATQLATKIGADADALHRLLQMLASIDILSEAATHRFTLTPLGETLRSDTVSSVRDYAVYVHDFIYEGFVGFDETVRTGKPAFDAIFGMPFFQYLQKNPDRAAVFHAGIGNRGRIEAKAIIDAYDFSTSRHVVDVGGGNGAFLSAILTTHNNVSGVLVDRSAAIDAAKSGRGGLLPRCEFVDGDIFEQVRSGGDTYTLKRLLFDFSDEGAVRILDNCRKAMRHDARLLIIEVLRAQSNQRDLAHAMDLVFLVLLGGRTRTKEQYATLLERAHFRFVRTIPTESDVTILEAVPI